MCLLYVFYVALCVSYAPCFFFMHHSLWAACAFFLTSFLVRAPRPSMPYSHFIHLDLVVLRCNVHIVIARLKYSKMTVSISTLSFLQFVWFRRSRLMFPSLSRPQNPKIQIQESLRAPSAAPSLTPSSSWALRCAWQARCMRYGGRLCMSVVCKDA